MGSRRRPSLIVVLAIAGLVAACGAPAAAPPSETASSTPAATPEPTPEQTATPEPSESLTTGLIELPDAGYAVTLPGNWFRITLDEEGIKAILDAGSEEMPEGFADVMTEQVRQMVGSGVSLLAYREPDGDAPIGTNANVISLPSGGLTLDTLETINKAQLQQMVGDEAEIVTSRVDLPSGEAVLMKYGFAGASGGSTAIEQYYLVGDEKQLILTCTLPEGGAASDDCRTIAESVEFAP